MRRPDAGRRPVQVEPKEITPADRLRLSGDITNPDRVVEAVSEIVTKTTGLTPNKLGAEFARMSSEEQDRFYGAEAQAFRESNPDYYPVPQNQQALFEELKANGWDLTRNNLTIVFETLKERGDIIPWPNDSEPREPESEAPQPVYVNGNARPKGQASTATARPRSISTGLRHSDANASAPPPLQKKKYTRADIERMSRAEYNDKLRSDPEFRRQVDAMGA
jgi:hypothetical protein